MRRACLLAALTGALLLAVVPVTQAEWFLRFGPVKRDSKRHVYKVCDHDKLCVGASTKCKRLTSKRINCTESTTDRPPELPEQVIKCNTIAKYGVGPGGVSTLTYGDPRCFVAPG